MSEDRTTYAFDDFRLVAGERLLFRKDIRVPLTPRAYDLLHMLVRYHGHLLEKDQILAEVWKDAVVEEGNLNRTISTLRKALGAPPGDQRYIETVPKVGYRFVGTVKISDEAAAAERPPRPARFFSAAKRWFLIHFGIAIMIVFLVAAFSRIFGPDPTTFAPAPKKVPLRLTDGPRDHDEAAWMRDGRVRFIRHEAGQSPRSFAIGSDGSDLQPGNREIPSLRVGNWSPDGRFVVFWKLDPEDQNAYLAESDGKNESRLPFRPANINWLDDGSGFVYHSVTREGADRNHDIYRYSMESRKSENLTNHPAFDADPSISADGKTIAFVSDRNGNQEVYLMNSDGADVRRLTHHPARESFPVISPDGTQLAFNSNRENETVGIYVTATDGSWPAIRVSDPSYSSEVRRRCWSDDGTRIVYRSNAEGKWQIYTMTVDPFGAALINVGVEGEITAADYSPDSKKMAIVESLGQDVALKIVDLETGQRHTVVTSEKAVVNPDFSPDGRSLAFSRKVEGNTDVWVAAVDGSQLTNLTLNPALDTSPSFSPDGKRIAFTSNRDGEYERHSIFVMNSDGTNQHRVTRNAGYEFDPDWSHDGSFIVFVADRQDGSSKGLDLWATRPDDGAEPIPVLSRKKHDSVPVISPDGKRIAFVSNSDGNPEIYLANKDGSGLLRLTRDVADDLAPAWSPDGKRLVFSSNRSGRFELYELVLN